MGWIHNEFAMPYAGDSEIHFESDECDTEIADGVVLERRSVLWLSLGAALTALGSSPLGAQDTPGVSKSGDKKKPSFTDFLKEVHPLAKRMAESKSQDDTAYLLTVAAALSRVGDPGDGVRRELREFTKKHKEDGKRFPISVSSMRLRAGGGFRHHDHRNYNGVIMGISGEVRIRNFDIQGKDPGPGKTLEIRETRDDLVLPGRFSSVGLRTDNIHELVAGKEGARVLDVFTMLGPGATSKYLDVEAKPKDAARRVYEAAWKTRRRRGSK